MLYHLNELRRKHSANTTIYYAHSSLRKYYNFLRSFLTTQILQFYHHSYFVIALLTP